MRKFYTKTKIQSNVEKDILYTNFIRKISSLDFKGAAGVALTATNFSKYEYIRSVLNLSHIYCLEDRSSTYQDMLKINGYNKLFPVKHQISDFLNTTTQAYKFGFIDLDFMTFWANILYPSNSPQVTMGYNMKEILPKILQNAPIPFVIMITAQANQRNRNNPLIRHISTAQDIVELFPSSMEIELHTYNSGKYKMETIFGILQKM